MNNAVIFMKWGFHVHDEATILQQKRDDLARFGWFVWGYNGTLCHPVKQVQPFARQGMREHGSVCLAMSPTSSKPDLGGNRATQFSVTGDARDYKPLPTGMNAFGSKYGIVCNGLSKCNDVLNLDEYEVAIGAKKGRLLSDYIAYQISKGCAVKRQGARGSVPVAITLHCNVIEPFAVFLR
jgi:hypothetical protein